MPARSSPRFRPSELLLRLIRSLDIDCDCKTTLIVSCAVGAASGCRERIRSGTCDCKPRWLPSCILDTPDGHGCARWREGKTCQCPRLEMPRCLVTGCDRRRLGKRCQCPRTPTELCPHVCQKIMAQRGLTFAAAERQADRWAELLWSVLPDVYGDRLPAAEGYPTPTHEEAVQLMQIRQHLGLSLWHPDDLRGLDEGGLDARQRMRRQAAGLKRLCVALAPARRAA